LFLDTIPAGPLRDALDICAIARVTSEWLLTERIGADEGRAGLEWLRGQSFIESNPLGVFPHDLAREVLIADARWRDDQRLPALSRRIYSALYATRIRPTNAAFFEWRDLDDVRVEPAAAEDVPWMAELAERYEGPVSAHSFASGPAYSRAPFRSFVEATTPVSDFSPCSRSRRSIRRHRTTRPSPKRSPASNVTGRSFRQKAPPIFVVDARGLVPGSHRRHQPDGDAPPADWIMGVRTPMPFATAMLERGGAAAPFTEAEFHSAVWTALRDYTRPDRLAASPPGSRLLSGLASGPDAGIALQRLLREAAASLQANPCDLKLYRAVWHTYFEPLETQEKVAERLDLPFSTYRHHLGGAIDRIAHWLWQRNRAGTPTAR